MAKRHWFINGSYMGSSEAKWRRVHGDVLKPIGHHYFCRHCGKLWASLPVDGYEHQVWSKPCADHGWKRGFGDPEPLWSSEVGGSLFMEWEPELVEEMPPAVVRWELLVHLRWAAGSSVLPPGIASKASDVFKLISAQL
jgi:hypothetical protein